MPTTPPRRVRTAALGALVAAAAVLSACGTDAAPPTPPRLPDPVPTVSAQAEKADASGVVHVGRLVAAGGSSTQLAHSHDRTAPTLTSITWTPTFYPVRDGYRDTFTVSATTSERTWITLVVRNSRNQLVRRVYAVHDAGRLGISWNGNLGSGRRAPAGSYRWYLVWHDASGNENYSARRSLTVSNRQLVTRTVEVTQNGNAFWKAGGSDPSCTQANPRASYYKRGVWLANDCSGSVAAAFYRLRLPAAVSYTTIGVQVWGFTDHAGTRIYRAYGSQGGTASFTGGTFVTLRDTSHRIRSFGSVPAAGKVNAQRWIVLALSVDNRPSGKRDIDINQVRFTIGYRVLS